MHHVSSLFQLTNPALPFTQPTQTHKQVSVANHPGQALSDSALQVGPAVSSDAAASGAHSDVQLSFVGPLVAPCPYTNDTGAELWEPCGAGLVTVTAKYFQVGHSAGG